MQIKSQEANEITCQTWMATGLQRTCASKIKIYFLKSERNYSEEKTANQS